MPTEVVVVESVYTGAELDAAWRAEGWRIDIPSWVSQETLDALEDQAWEMECLGCGSEGLVVMSYTRGESWRAMAVCPCGAAFEL